jgi:glycine/D-amino acid oxidase-like deaminating enzyme
MAPLAALSGTQKCDIVVIGAGLTGITTALLLAKSGARVIVLEADRVGGGTTGHTTAKVTIQHALKYHTLAPGKAAAYAAANQAGLDQIAALVVAHNIACDFVRTDAFVYAQSSEDVAQLNQEMGAYETLGIGGHLVTKTALPFSVRGALMVENQASFHPLKYLYALTLCR